MIDFSLKAIKVGLENLDFASQFKSYKSDKELKEMCNV